MPVLNFGGPPPKKFLGQKHAKFDPISDDFKVQRRIKIFKIGLGGLYRDSSRVGCKKSGELWSSNHGD